MHTLCSKGFENYISTFSIAHCNVSNSFSKTNAFKGGGVIFKSLVPIFPLWEKDITSNLVCLMAESEGFLVQSSAITSASSSGSPVRDRFALTLSFSSNFLLRLRSSSLMFALSEGPSSSESTISTSSCSCAYIKEKRKDG